MNMYTRQFLETILFLILEHERKLLFENTKNVILIRLYALLKPFKWYKFGFFVIYNIIQIRNAVLILNRIILLLQYGFRRSNGASVIVLI